MKAACWMGVRDVEVQTVDDPRILNPRDCIVRVTSTAIGGSDLHLYEGHMPSMERGDILGHEFMGEVVEIGPGVQRLAVGDRVVVPCTISCGCCAHCVREEWSCCDNTNPNASAAEKAYGQVGAALFGSSHLLGGYAGGQAQFVRVPFADVGPLRLEEDLTDEQVLFLSDVFPTGYVAAENCAIEPGRSTVAVWGCGSVGQFAIRAAFLLGAAKVIAIDVLTDRLRLAATAGALTIHDGEEDVMARLMDLTGGRGPDAAIDAVGMEAHGSAFDAVKHRLSREHDRPHALHAAIRAVRKGGVISVPGAYAGTIDRVSFGALFEKGVTVKSGRPHIRKYLQPLLALIANGRIDPAFVITHRLPLSRTREAYAIFAEKRQGCIKVVLDPAA